MSKVKEKMKTESVVEESKNGTVTSNDNAKDVIEALKIQFADHQKKADFHTTMATKAQGALEVLLQLHPQGDSSEEK